MINYYSLMIACLLSNELFTSAYGFVLREFLFQCTGGKSRIHVCQYPKQFCDDFYYECRPCSKDVCDRKEDFPLQCSYNCTIGKQVNTQDPSFIKFERTRSGNTTINDHRHKMTSLSAISKTNTDPRKNRELELQYITRTGPYDEDPGNNATVWFIMTISLLVILSVLVVVFCPISRKKIKSWLKDLKEKTLRPKPVAVAEAEAEAGAEAEAEAGAEAEERPLIKNTKDEVSDETSVLKMAEEKTNSRPASPGSNETGGYCEQKFKNIAPTNEQADVKMEVATSGAKLPEAKSMQQACG